tara:strand:- start:4662 stop:5354 length:693 start_codon:yes stop_codon:yes gene_type:complete
MTTKLYFVVGLVITLFLSCDDIIELEDISNQEILVLAPKEGSIIGSNTVNFNWEKVNDATAYHMQIAQPDFENASQILVDSTMVEDTLGFVSTRIEKALLNGSYQWRIKASNSGFETGYVTFGFEVQGDENADIIPPNTPELVTPLNEATQEDTAVNFSWRREDISGTTERDSIYIYKEEDLLTLELKGLGANKTFLTTLTSGKTYYWRVKAFDASNESEASSVFKFTIN